MDADEILDGFALWEEHKPQTGEDWVKVAERVIADGDSTEKGSPLFAAVGIAVHEREAAESRCKGLEEALNGILASAQKRARTALEEGSK